MNSCRSVMLAMRYGIKVLASAAVEMTIVPPVSPPALEDACSLPLQASMIVRISSAMVKPET